MPLHAAAMSHFPAARHRRNRRDDWSRSLVQEHRLSVRDLIYPMFVVEGRDRSEAVASMPGVSRQSIDRLIPSATRAAELGIPLLALFPMIEPSAKDPSGLESFNPEGLIPRAVRAIKAACPTIGVMTDVALDPYTSHGQDGVIDQQGRILNDETVSILCKQAVMQAQAGVDVVAPSDMMDGRIGAIRQALEAELLIHTRIMSYAAKYASCFYGPFREAVGSAGSLGKSDKKTYQMDPANGEEAFREVGLDIAEGADMVMVKPGLPYLDVVYRIKQAFGMPTFAYQVSGEYAMMKAAAENGWLDEEQVVMESLLCFKRAGADGVLTYSALDAAEWLRRR